MHGRNFDAHTEDGGRVDAVENDLDVFALHAVIAGHRAGRDAADAFNTAGNRAFVGDVQRVEAQQLTGGVHRRLDRDGLFIDDDTHVGLLGDLVQRCR